MATKKKTTRRSTKAKIDKGTVKKTVETVREMKWKIPPECDTAEKKKQFRQKNRNKLRKMEAELLTNPSPKLERSYKALRRKVLLVP